MSRGPCPRDPVEAPTLRLDGITKRFPGVLANDGVSIAAWPGEVHAILGENGAGKSTLMSILYGLFPPDAGRIYIDEVEHRFRSSADAINAGLGMVFQTFKLFEPLSVTENVVYGSEPGRSRFLLDRREAKRRVRELGDQYGLPVDPSATVAELSVGQRQRVEILKALYRDARIVILDEPTAVLTPLQVDSLFEVLDRLRSDGRTILFITHKLNEVIEISDRATVLRRGRVVASELTAETSAAELAGHMTGRSVSLGQRAAKREPGDAALVVSDLTAWEDDGSRILRDASLTVRSGEIVGIAGVAGSGQELLVRSIVGLTAARSGSISVNGVCLNSLSVGERRQFLAHVPEDRDAVGSAGGASVIDNLLIGYQRDERFSRRQKIDWSAVRSHADGLIDRYGVKVADRSAPVRALSGGNLQKLVTAREMSHEAILLIAEQPTRGVDIGAIEFIHNQLVAYRDAGGAVLLVSAELSELLAISTRILVMFDGHIVAELDPDTTDDYEIGLHMTGAAATSGVHPEAV